MSLLYFLLTLPSASLAQEFDCIFYKIGEIKDNCGGCGICQKTDEDTETFVCTWKYSRYFVPDVQCRVLDLCQAKRVCPTNIICAPMFGNTKCLCDSVTYGRLCEFQMLPGVSHQDYAVVNDIIFNPVTSYDRGLTISLFLGNIGKNLDVRLITAFENLYYNSTFCKKESLDDYCRKYYSDLPNVCMKRTQLKNSACVMTFNMALTMTYYDPTDNFEAINWYVNPKTESTLLSLPFIFKLEVYNILVNNVEAVVFKNEENFWYVANNLMISPNVLLKCEPRLTVNNAEISNSSATEYTRPEEIVLTGSYQLRDTDVCKDSDNVLQRWYVWKVGINHDITRDPYFLEVYNEKELQFKPFSLDYGSYKVKYYVSVWVSNEQVFGVKYAYFKINHLNLEPVISGGAEKTVFYNIKALKLDGSFSKDPNLSPSEQTGSLEFHWSCDKNIPLCTSRISDYNVTYPGPFQKNEIFTFKLTIVSKSNRQYYASTVQKVLMAEKALEINCKKNCGDSKYEANPSILIYLEATADSNDALVWTYSKGTTGSFSPVTEIHQANTPNNILIISKNTLDHGEFYTFKVAFRDESSIFSKYQVKMADKVDTFSCEIIIKTGVSFKIIRGSTEVKISCNPIHHTILSPIYSFYNKYQSANNNETGRLLVSGRSNGTGLVKLTREFIVVQVANEFGIMGVTEISVDLHDITDYTKVLKDEIEDLKSSRSTSDTYFKINSMFVVLDLLATGAHQISEKEVLQIIEDMLKVASTDEISNIEALKMWTSLFNNLKVFENKLTTKSINFLSIATRHLSSKLLKEIRTDQAQSNELSVTDVYVLCQMMLSVSNTIYETSKKNLENIREKSKVTKTLNSFYKETSDSLVSTVGRIMLCLSLISLPFESPVTLKEEHIKIWVKEDTPESFVGMETLPSVTVSERLAKSLKHTSKFIIIQVADYDGDPYWYKQEFEIHTNVVDVRIRHRNKNRISYVTDTSQSILIQLKQFNSLQTTLNGSVQQPRAGDSGDANDTKVAVYQLRAPQRGILDLNFFNLEEDMKFKVLILLNLRPDYKYVTEAGTEVNKSSPLYRFEIKAPRSYDVYDLYYLGILPGQNVGPLEVLNYTFKISTTHCATWKIYEWATFGCKVDNVTKTDDLHCECEHLSTFAGFSRVPINAINPFEDYKLFLDIHKNPYVAVFVICILLMYLMLLIWAIKKDAKEKLKGQIIYLEDNFPSDKFAYLVAVYTGYKLFSGTDANVGLIIEGNLSCSRPHILKSSLYPTLQRGDDNWFLLFTPNHLGKIELIHLWMDYSGRRPEWFCYKIIIVDIHTNKNYYFYIDTWMSLREGYHVQRFVKPSKLEDHNRMSLIIDNLVYGFRETHLWMSVLSRHPRSSVNRAQRLSVAVSGLLVTMLVSCMFYGVVDESAEDLPKYQLRFQEFAVGILAMLITSVLINLVMSSFRRQMVLQKFEDMDIELEEDEEVDVKEDTKSLSKKKPKDEIENKGVCTRLCEDFFKAFIKRKQFKPVFLTEEIEYASPKKKRCETYWNIFSWSVCISLTMICSVLIVLYSLKFGKVKSLEWLTCVVLSLGQVLFIAAPSKIITLAALSGILASNMYEVLSHHVTPEIMAKYKLMYLKFKPERAKTFLSHRNHRIYFPLGYLEMLKKFHSQRRTDTAWFLIDLFLVGLLYVCVCLQNETLWTTKYYWNNKQLLSILQKSYKEDGIQLQDLHNISIYLKLMDQNVLPVIFQTKWYNKMLINNNDSTLNSVFVFGGTSILFGLPRLRQQRLRPDLCREQRLKDLPLSCDVELLEHTQDTDIYAEGWISRGSYEEFVKLSPWNYLNSTQTSEGILYGSSSLGYQGGGYIADLAMTEEKSDNIVNYLQREKWLNNLTSFVVFELTLYNAFTGTFSWLVSITENLHIGMLMNRVHVVTVSQDFELSANDILVFVSLMLFIVRVFFLINWNGFEKLPWNFWNIFEIIIICFFILAVFVFAQNIAIRSEYLKTYNEDTREHYFEFFHLLYYLEEFQLILIVLLILLVCRSVKNWNFTETFHVFSRTLSPNWNQIFWIFSYLSLVLFIHWRIILFLSNSFLLNRNNFLIISKLDFKYIVKKCIETSCKLDLFLVCSVSHLAKLLVIAFFISRFRVVKRKYKDKIYINLCTIFYKKSQEYELLLKCKNINENFEA